LIFHWNYPGGDRPEGPNPGYFRTLLKRSMRSIEIEYAIGSAIAHGSEGAILDVLPIEPGDPSRRRHSRTSEQFSTVESIIRTALGMLVFLKGMEQAHDRDMGAGLHLRSTALLMGDVPKYSFFTYIAYL
jgi:hypothetical protein